MKKSLFILFAMLNGILLQAGIVEKTFYFDSYKIESRGVYQTVNFGNTILAGVTGDPMLPWHEITLMLPPGEAAETIEVIEENEKTIPGSFLIYPKQEVRPLSTEKPFAFVKNEKVYRQTFDYPVRRTGHLMTQYLNGYAFALCTFTPVKYNPASGTLTFFRKVTVRITTHADAASMAALINLPGTGNTPDRVKTFAMNAEMMQMYPQRKAPATNYQYLIISPVAFKNEFQPLISMYSSKGIIVKVVTTDSISLIGTGWDLKEKIRNFIISQYQTCGITYVLLAGNPALVPSRGFYCYVISGSGYADSNIPADLYFSGLDGTYDANGNHLYGEVADNPDLLPEISVGRFTVNDTAELHRMIRKTVSYQTKPVLGEFSRPLLAGEFLYNPPLTFGGNYLNLLVNNHSDNGYYTHGIPSATNVIEKLYDTLVTLSPFSYWSWTSTLLLASFNRGNSFIHHVGHSNSTYMMRLSMGSITNANFANVNGTTHNYQFLYTQGCDCGAFDQGCIAAKAVSIDNFLVAGIFNSRYGWFDEGTTEGPSEHLEREFVSAIYNDTLPEKHLGTAHVISKIKTAPWVSLPGEFEPGAQRWCHYDCNVFGDPAMEIRTEEPTSFTSISWTGNVDSDWNKPGNWNLAMVPTSLYDVTIPDTPNDPVITTSNTVFCHNLNIQNGGNLTINAGKSMVVYGTVTMLAE
ncbi:MAG: C25 family cysteine peptidase [Bacteroidota bacterium]